MISGLDVSRWQPPEKLNYQKLFDAGYKFAAIRCTVGDYYTDKAFPAHWDNFGAAGFMRTPYLVVAPADSTGRQISISQHMQHFINTFGDREAELPWVVDCELTRGQSRAYITDLVGGIVESCFVFINRYPMIYTRQSWWDHILYPDPIWPKCPLYAARYSDSLTEPWSDGYYSFRDWTTWFFWQWTSHGRVPDYSGDMDLDYFNGNLDDLVLFSGNLTQKAMLKILWREAEKAGWSLKP